MYFSKTGYQCQYKINIACRSEHVHTIILSKVALSIPNNRHRSDIYVFMQNKRTISSSMKYVISTFVWIVGH